MEELNSIEIVATIIVAMIFIVFVVFFLLFMDYIGDVSTNLFRGSFVKYIVYRFKE